MDTTNNSQQYTIYIGNLPWSETNESLLSFFESHNLQVAQDESGEPMIKIITDYKNNNRSKGFGFVTLANEENYNKALELNGTEINGRNITIQPKQDRPPKQSRYGNFRRGGANFGNDSRRSNSNYRSNDSRRGGGYFR
jgi:nucleolin